MPVPATLAPRAIFQEEEPMIDLKWYVIGAGLIAFALLASYDQALGIAAGVVLAVIAAIRISLWFLLAPEKGAPESERGAMIERFQRLSENRRKAHNMAQLAKTKAHAIRSRFRRG